MGLGDWINRNIVEYQPEDPPPKPEDPPEQRAKRVALVPIRPAQDLLAELEPAEQLGVLRQQRHHLRRDPLQQGGVGLEEVLVEVGVGHLPRAKREGAGQSAAGVDVGGQRRVRGVRVGHGGHSTGRAGDRVYGGGHGGPH